MFKRTLMAGVAALTMGGTLATTVSPAQAQYWGGGYYGGWGGYRSVGYYPGGYGYGYYPRYGYGYGYPYYRRHHSNGGAVAAGVIGGLALGAIAANAARPAYYAPAYGYRNCWVERRRTVNRFGDLVIRRVRVCG